MSEDTGEDESKTADDRIQFINPPPTLNAKVSIGGPGAVNQTVLARAEAVIADLSGDYMEWAQEDLRQIQEAIDSIDPNSDEEQRKKVLNRVFAISHDIKGQGGSFGYDLMTIIGNDLCRFSETIETLKSSDVEVIRLHVDTMKRVIADDIQGDGGKEGEMVLSGLAAVVEKVTRA